MFAQLFLFELQYRLRRPAVYIYLFIALAWPAFLFANGMVPAEEKEFTNAPAALALYAAIMSFFLMLMSAFFMGVALYRDIEHGTKEYYLSYPITKPGYFFGRFLGSFVFVALTGAVAMAGPWLGTQLGSAFHLQRSDRIGPNLFIYYWQPFWTIMLPNLFFTSCLFFGLVSLFRTAKVIYSGAMLLFLGYLIGNFFLNNIHDPTVIYLSDPFVFNGLRAELSAWSSQRLNTSVVPLQGLLLQNRILWISVGLAGLLLPYWRFSFQRFFSVGRSGKREHSASPPPFAIPDPSQLAIRFNGNYQPKVLFNLAKIELLNIVRDTYFWIILTGGFIFVGFVFLNGPGEYGIHDYPRTIFFMDVFQDMFMLFIFIIIVLYTGETVHREKLTRYHLINDTLPPPTWILNGAKLISLLCLGIGLALTPVWLGLLTQLLKGYTDFNFSQYVSSELVALIPRVTEFVLLAYGIHVAVSNKFLAHGIAISFYLALLGLKEFHYADYNLLLYSSAPGFWASDMDGIGHMVRPVLWYQLYWTLAGCALVVAASLLYVRGTRTSTREKMRLAKERFQGASRWGLVALLLGLGAAGSYIYYNVSYLNEYLTPWEHKERSAIAERTLKKYAALPLPKLTSVQMKVDLFPKEQRVETVAFCTLANKGTATIDSLLLDADGIEFTLYYDSKLLPFTNPLYFHRGEFNWFRPRQEPSDYRVYRLPLSLRPRDSITLEVHSTKAFNGFQNGLYAANLLHNGSINAGNLPAVGYDEDEELSNTDDRREHGLPLKKDIPIPQDDPIGRRQLNNDFHADLVRTDITISAPQDQWAVAPGNLEKEWSEQGRHFFHYVQDDPGAYLPFAILSARYTLLKDTVQLAGRVLPICIAHLPGHYRNLSHFDQAVKDGLHFFSNAFGPYPFSRLSFAETPAYGPFAISLPAVIGMSEPRGGWIADLRGNPQPDYVYYSAAEQVAHQWWGQQAAGNHTVGSGVITQAVPDYAALRLTERRYGKAAVSPIYERMLGEFRWFRRINWNPNGEAPLLYGDRSYISRQKGALVLYGLAEFIGEDSVNAALADFLHQWAFRNGGPYPGANDLYAVLKAHTPDSLRYYLEDGWEKVVLYDNQVNEAVLLPHAKDSSYRVRIHVTIQKLQYDTKNESHAVKEMNDLVDIGIFGEAGGNGAPPLLQVYTARYKAGEHTIGLNLRQKPSLVEIDPHRKLLDIRGEDNRKMITAGP